VTKCLFTSKLLILGAMVSMMVGCSPSADFRYRMWETFMTNGEHANASEKYEAACTMYAAALEQLAGAPRLDRKAIRTLVELGWARLLAGQTNQALPVLQDAAARCDEALATTGLDKDDFSALNNLAMRAQAGIGECYRAANQNDNAEAAYNKAIALSSHAGIETKHGYDRSAEAVVRAHRGKAEILLAEKNLSQAMASYDRAARISDITAGAMTLKSDCRQRFRHLLWLTGDDTLAHNLETGTWRRYIRHADQAIGEKDYEMAIFEYKRALAKLPGEIGDEYTEAATMIALARVYLLAGQPKAAQEICQKALKLPLSDPHLTTNALASTAESLLQRCH
jgi:tetratricopeptide (TPR) repeat protein